MVQGGRDPELEVGAARLDLREIDGERHGAGAAPGALRGPSAALARRKNRARTRAPDREAAVRIGVR